MLIKKILFFVACLHAAAAFAQNYDVSLINDSLLHHADAVKRSEELHIIIKSTSRAVVMHRYAVTVLNEAGNDAAVYTNVYDKTETFSSISGTLYDARGKEIRSVKKKDFGDFSGEDESLVTDNRLKRYNFSPSQYPYTVEFEDEKDIDGIYFLPHWSPVEGTEYSVEQSDFIVETPADFNLRYKDVNYSGLPAVTGTGNKKIYSWQVRGITAVNREPYQPAWNNLVTSVYIAPSQFEIENYKGDMSSWLGLGQFIQKLNAGRQELPDNVKHDVHSLIDQVKDTTEKINLLYQYLQKNTRYISIQLGIGSWQPFKAEFVAQKKYGDCKALSNYMVSLLREAGIPGKYVIIFASENDPGLWEDFPSPYFNHAIVCVPRGRDTTWLECTNQDMSAGYMGGYTSNRKALLIDDDGGHIVSTARYSAGDNLQLRKTEGVIDAEGNFSASVITHYTGLQQDLPGSLIHNVDQKQKQSFLNNSLSLPTYSVEKYEFKETKARIPAVDEYLSLRSPNYAIITGKRLFITPNIFNRSQRRLPEDSARKYDLNFPESYIDEDTLHIKLPAGYTVEAMPAPLSLKTKYGSYSINFAVKDDAIDLLRKNEVNAGRYSRTEYRAAAAYLNAIYKADRGKIVLVKKGE